MHGLCGAFLANPWWSWHTTFHKRVREHTAIARVQFFFGAVPPAPLCVWAAGLDVFRHNGLIWVDRHSVKEVLQKRSQSQSRIKRMKRRGRERMTTVCLVLKNAKTGQVWLLEESAIDWDVCEKQVFLFTAQAFNVEPTLWFYPCGTTWGSSYTYTF